MKPELTSLPVTTSAGSWCRRQGEGGDSLVLFCASALAWAFFSIKLVLCVAFFRGVFVLFFFLKKKTMPNLNRSTGKGN